MIIKYYIIKKKSKPDYSGWNSSYFLHAANVALLFRTGKFAGVLYNILSHAQFGTLFGSRAG